MKTKKWIFLGIHLTLNVLFSSCKKDWLNGKPNESLVVPTSVNDYQALLDNTSVMNMTQPSLYMLGDGDFKLSDAKYNAVSIPEQQAYIWGETKNFYGGEPSLDWKYTYQTILNANVVVDGLQTLQVVQTSRSAFNNVYGSALFFRSLCYYDLAQMYCKPYNAITAGVDYGLPLRISSNVNLSIKRSSVQQTYDQIISDLVKATQLLTGVPPYPTRPSKSAAFGLLARVYLSQQNYNKALLYADSSLKLNNTLINFNDLISTAQYPIPKFNSEDIFHCTLDFYASFKASRLIVDSVLHASYAPNDLRATVYFAPEGGTFAFKGSYDGDQTFFGGIATDEVYLIRAECYARLGNTAAAMQDLNSLLKTRWLTGTYTDLVAPSADAALLLIIGERRKELCFRGLRWTDLRRLNTDSRFQKTITRVLNGQTYTLLPNSPKYVLPIDSYEIQVGGLTQNPR